MPFLGSSRNNETELPSPIEGTQRFITKTPQGFRENIIPIKLGGPSAERNIPSTDPEYKRISNEIKLAIQNSKILDAIKQVKIEGNPKPKPIAEEFGGEA